ncbi:MAG TPA: ATP-binding protein [Thermosynechococcaceae cyanobacterium]
MPTLLTLEIRYEQDVVLTRQRARQIAALLKFDAQDQTRIATAVSEIARNAFQYAKGGRAEFGVEERSQTLAITVRDRGRGMANLKQVLAGQHVSSTGLGLGITGTQRLMDQFEIESSDQGTIVRMEKRLPRQAPPLTPDSITAIVNELVQRSPQSPLQEIQQQNQELLRALEALRKREEELVNLNQELEDTNRGVVALYAELDEKADSLRRANELKTRFLSNMSHEFRTPVNSILSLSRLLLDRFDGDLTPDQEKQITFIQKSATGLSELVNDLLDLAKVEAGKITVRAAPFEISELFATLRGMLRPLLIHNSSVDLVFEEPIDLPTLHTDEGKVAQILRNFISNALKFTQQGEVRVGAVLQDDLILLSVADTGIGIAAADQERIFEDFIQVESAVQRQVKGTGLGLPLSRKLAELLGGYVSLTSTEGTGSTFSASIPIVYPGELEPIPAPAPAVWQRDPQRLPVLVVEDNPETLFTYEKYLERSCYQALPVRTIAQAREVLAQITPVAILLDVLLEGQNTLSFLSELKANPEMQRIPILVATVIDNQQQALLRGADVFLNKPVDRLVLLSQINKLTRRSDRQKILLIDDSSTVRYWLKQYLSGTLLHILEAENGAEGVRLAQAEQPQAIVLDWVMPGMSGLEVVQQLKANQVTQGIAIVLHTSHSFTAIEQAELADRTVAIVAKDEASRDRATASLCEALIRTGLVLETGGMTHV